MYKFKPLIIIALFFFSSCQNESSNNSNADESSLEETIAQLKENDKIDQELVSHFFKQVDDFVINNPESEDAPEHLELKAKYLTALGKNVEAYIVYEKIYNKYPKFKNHADALFMMAFIQENDLKNKEKAEVLYNQYIQVFPNGEFANDAQFSIDNINMTDEELMEMLKMKNEENSID